MVFNPVTNLFFQFGSIVDIFYQWEYLRVFDIILPFLLIFAVVFGILSNIKMFGENKGVNVIIAVILGLLAVRFPIYSDFLAVISPKLGIGLIVLLSLLILIGLFTPKAGRGVILWVLMGVGAIVFIIIITQTFNIFGGFYGATSSGDIIGYVVLVALLIGVIVAITVGGGSGKTVPEGGRIWGPLFHDS